MISFSHCLPPQEVFSTAVPRAVLWAMRNMEEKRTGVRTQEPYRPRPPPSNYCDVCGQTYSITYSLRRHMKTCPAAWWRSGQIEVGVPHIWVLYFEKNMWTCKRVQRDIHDDPTTSSSWKTTAAATRRLVFPIANGIAIVINACCWTTAVGTHCVTAVVSYQESRTRSVYASGIAAVTNV